MRAPRRPIESAAVAIASALALVGCATTPVRGVVFADRNGDGVRQKDEPGVPGAVVALDRAVFTTTGMNGSYEMLAGVELGRLWVRVPAGYRVGQVWRTFDGSSIDLPLVPLTAAEAASPLTFIIASDSHMKDRDGADTIANAWDGGDLADAIDQALSLPDKPRFFAIDGDMTNGGHEPEYLSLGEALTGVTVPWIPVAGNHDWGGEGAGWFHKFYGLDNYSFDIGNVHFVVWNTNGVDIDPADELDFLAKDLAHVSSAMTVVALSHHAVFDTVVTQMEALGVDYMFTGHWHANRRIQHPHIVEFSTQPFIMGSIDQSVPGYRIVTFEGGTPRITFREKMVESHLALVAPHAGTCVPATGFPVLASAALDASTPEVTLRVDCGPEQTLTAGGGWSFASSVGPLSSGTHSLTLSALSAGGRRVEKQVAIEVCAQAAPVATLGEWPQLGGSAAHTNARTAPVTPPLVTRWTTNVGGAISLGTPVVLGGLAIVTVIDNASGDQGGLVALDLVTGAERWRYRTPFPAVGAAAAQGTVVVTTKQGVVHAVDLATGTPKWTRDIAAGLTSHSSSLWAAPTIADDLVYVAVQGNFAALDLETGVPTWERDPVDPQYHWLGSLASVAVADGSAVAAFNRTRGLASWSAATGAQLWDQFSGDPQAPDYTTVAVNGSPVIDNGTLYFVTSLGTISAGPLAGESNQTWRPTWARQVTPGANEWHYSTTVTPAVANGRVFVPTLWNDLVALDAASGAELWRAQAPTGPINYAHYQSAIASWVSSAVVTGDLVWIGGLDGTLFAFAADDGHLAWSTHLGAPITSAPAPAGDALVVATYDGTVRLLAPGTPAAPTAVSACPATAPLIVTRSDNGCATGRSTSLLSALALLFLLRRRARR